MSLLSNKVALITGASAGIGRATALAFAAEGAAVVLNARNAAPLAEVVEAIRASGGQAVGVAGDIAATETHEALVAAAECEFGGLDIAVNNAAAVGPYLPLAELTLETWREVIDTNLTGAFLGAKSQIPAMLARGGGSLVFVSTFVGTSVGIPGMGVYGTSKAALMGLVKGVTADYGAQGIRANALLPGGPTRAWPAMRRRRNGPPGCTRSSGSPSPRRSPRRRCSWPVRWPVSWPAQHSMPTAAMRR